jgi:hypothetical protein
MRTSDLDREATAVVRGLTMGSTRRDVARKQQYLAVVEGLEGVRYVALADSLEGLWARLCGHVRTWSMYQLSGEVHDRVTSALEAGQLEAAVKLYFDHAGRWEPEKLSLRTLAADGTAHFHS